MTIGFATDAFQNDAFQMEIVVPEAEPVVTIGLAVTPPIDFVLQGGWRYAALPWRRPAPHVPSHIVEPVLEHDELQEMMKMYQEWRKAA